MGTKFFQPKSPGFTPQGIGLEARSIGASSFAGRAAGGAANKDIGAAMALYKAHALKPHTGSSAYAPGPKKL
jgi:hypothetical protein